MYNFTGFAGLDYNIVRMMDEALEMNKNYVKKTCRMIQLETVIKFAKTATTKKAIADFGYKTFSWKADDGLIAKTKKADIVAALEARLSNLIDNAKNMAKLENK